MQSDHEDQHVQTQRSDFEATHASVSHRSGRYFLPVAIIYALGAVWTVCAYRDRINPDGVCYISIAQKYLTGDFWTAINAYWSPLYSWLLAPFLLSGMAPTHATMVLGTLIGLATVIASWKLAENLRFRESSRIALCLTLTPIALYLASNVISPDLLAAAVILFYLAHLTKPDYLDRRFSGVISGVVGAIGYLAKAYLFWFFLVHFLTVCVWWLCVRKDSRRRAMAIAATALVTFFFVAAIWVIPLSHKYHRLMTSSAGSYNQAYSGPALPRLPMFTQGLIPPSNSTAISAYEELTKLPTPTWNPLATTAGLKYELGLIVSNTRGIFGFLQWYSALSIAILGISVFLAGTNLDPKPHRPLSLLMLAVVIYPLGYLPLHVETRFLSPMVFLLLLLGIFFIEMLPVNRIGRFRRLMLIIFVCVTFLRSPVRSIWRYRGAEREVHDHALQLASMVPKGSRVASDGHCNDTLFLAFHDGWAYFGQTKPDATADIYADLKRHRIQFFCVWEDPQSYPFMKDWRRIPSPGFGDPQVYAVPQENSQ